MTVIQIVATADCFVNSTTGQENTVNNGTSIAMTGATATTTKDRAFLKFPLAGNVPSGATINSARLGFAPNAIVTVVTAFDFHPLIANFDWTEAGATWNHKNTTGSVAWAGGSNGGSVDDTDIDDDVIVCTTSWTNTPVADAADTFKEHTIDTAFIQAISDGTGSYHAADRVVQVHGWRQGSSNSAGVTFRSRSSTGGIYAPYLEVDYTSDDPAVSGTATSRATDAVAFPQCTYTGDTDDNEVVTVKRKVQGAADGTYVTLATFYDRTAKIAYAGHVVDFGAGNVTHKGDIALTPGTTYTFQFTWSGGGTVKTVDQTMLARLDPLAHSGRGTRKVPTAWWWKGSNTISAANIRKNAWIVTTLDGTEAAENAEIRNGATDIPIYQYIGPEFRRNYDVGTPVPEDLDVDGGRNTWLYRDYVYDDFLLSFSETWFTHNGGSARTDRVYNASYDTFVMNYSVPGFRSWVYKWFLELLYSEHTDQTTAADRFNGIIQDNLQGTSVFDVQWRTIAAASRPPTETAIDTKEEYSATQLAFLDFLVATGTYFGVNNVNATSTNHTDYAPHFDALFIESTFTSYEGAGSMDYISSSAWKADVDHVIALRSLVQDHIVCSMQLGDTPLQINVEYAAWSLAMVTDALGAGGSVIIRPTDNADYDEDEIASSGTTVFDVDWGAPTAGYQQDVTAAGGSGTDRVYYRDFANGRVWFNPIEPTPGPNLTLTPTGGPTLAPGTGIFISSGSDQPRVRIMHHLREQGIS